MKIGVLGSGVVGQVPGAGFLKHGHAVMMGTRDPGKPEVQKWLRDNSQAAAGGVLQFTTGPNESLAERLQAQAPEARLAKAFNSVGSGRMLKTRFEQGTPTMFYCGGLAAARALEPLCMLWCIPGFLRGQWDHAFKLLVG